MLSVILCTHNPRPDYLERTIAALQQQSLEQTHWEFLLIDNASREALPSSLVSWHPQGRVIREVQLGLTAARLRGFRESQGRLLVFVDDDNLLDTHYLTRVQEIFQQHPQMGAIAGKCLPEFEVEPPAWISEFYQILALRDFGDIPLMAAGEIGQRTYPEFAPAGAGMALRRQAFISYAGKVQHDDRRLALGRTGQQLSSGEDNDMILSLLQAGWGVGYFPQLQLTHLIAAHRLQPDYLARLNYASSRCWVQVLALNGIRLWQKIPTWTVRLRQFKAWCRYQPWRNPVAYIRWCGICGLLEGQSILP